MALTRAFLSDKLLMRYGMSSERCGIIPLMQPEKQKLRNLLTHEELRAWGKVLWQATCTNIIKYFSIKIHPQVNEGMGNMFRRAPLQGMEGAGKKERYGSNTAHY
jgi:hypothetical protein